MLDVALTMLIQKGLHIRIKHSACVALLFLSLFYNYQKTSTFSAIRFVLSRNASKSEPKGA